MTKRKKPSIGKPKAWRRFPAETYQEAITAGVHFSTKAVNTNAPAGGIRVGQVARVDLPYVAVSTLASIDSVRLDYEGNAAKATPMKQADWLLSGQAEGLGLSVPGPDAVAIRDAFSNAQATPYERFGHNVSKRLRQVIVQDAAGNDLALTPLHSAGFSELLNGRLKAEREQSESNRTKMRPRLHGILGIGGANPQNVGLHVRAMHDPLFFSAPTENQELRRALAIHYRGIELRIRPQDLKEYNAWRTAQIAAHRGVMPSDAKLRKWESDWLARVTRRVLDNAAAATALLDRHLANMPSGARTSERVDAVIRGLLDEQLRGPSWPGHFALLVRDALIRTPFRRNDGRESFLGVGEEATVRWIDDIERVL